MDRAKNCQECNKPFGFFQKVNVCPQAQGGCNRILCSNCYCYTITLEKNVFRGYDAELTTFCKYCYFKHTSLDFTIKEEVFGPEQSTLPTLIWIHGGGGCRKMFIPHARELAKKNIRSVLIDLPGHGSRMEEQLNTENAIQTISKTIDQQITSQNGVLPILIGGSLGGYLLMEVVGRFPKKIAGAIITMCGQNVGVGRSFSSSVGLSLMNTAMSVASSSMVLQQMIFAAKRNGHIPAELMLEQAMRPGMFFQQGENTVQILRSSDPTRYLPLYDGKILFINGSLDHRDSEQVWLRSCKKGRLINYDGADHFFSHDTRYIQTFLGDIQAFINDIANPQGKDESKLQIQQQQL